MNPTDSFLVDASVWVAAGVTASPANADAQRFVRSGASLIALDLTLYEVINAVGRRYRQPELARRVAQALLSSCDGDLCRVDGSLAEDLTEVVGEHGLSAYDAAYVAAARRHGWQLVSLDVRDLVSKGLAVTPDAALYP
ncbi:MAG TPA: PIN domain-containing protein [Solirubrobacterales bacterium]|nr:PIN domain-containing protein [Solirubrobacterales bacterium]